MRRHGGLHRLDDGPFVTSHEVADGGVELGFGEDVAGHGGVLLNAGVKPWREPIV
jgi:hypothetical protein